MRGPTHKQVFEYLREKVKPLQRLPREALTAEERREEDALMYALGAIQELSGGMHPLDSLYDEKMPPPRKHYDGDWPEEEEPDYDAWERESLARRREVEKNINKTLKKE